MIWLSEAHEKPKGDPLVFFVTPSKHIARTPGDWVILLNTQEGLEVTLWFLRHTQRTYLKGSGRLGYFRPTRSLKMTLWFLFTHSKHIARVPDD